MFTKKYDWASKDILDQFEVNYEVVEKVLSDIKQKVDKYERSLNDNGSKTEQQNNCWN